MHVFEIMRKKAETLYDSTCTIKEFSKQSGVINNTHAVVVAENLPCRLSYKSSPNASEGEAASALSQQIKLFLPPSITIKPGSEIFVTRNGVTTEYKSSGQPAVYISHQEVVLSLKVGRA